MYRRGVLWDRGLKKIIYPDDWSGSKEGQVDSSPSSDGSPSKHSSPDDEDDEDEEDDDAMDVEQLSEGWGRLPGWTKCYIPLDATVNSDNCDELAQVKLTEDDHTPNYRNGRGLNDHNSVGEDGEWAPDLLKQRYRSWLNSMPEWEHGLGKGWEGKRVLGRGGYGIAGLWEYQGELENKYVGQYRYRVKHVVVKQQRAMGGQGQRMEGKWMKLLNKTGSRHFPKLFKRVYREAGTGTFKLRIDSDRREVHRMFMEYCAGGDLQAVIDTLREPYIGGEYKFMREDKVWAVLLCFAKAVMVMHRGSEDITSKGWEHRDLVHFDIKPLNLFIGQKTSEEDHIRMPVQKVGDMGLMSEVPAGDQTKFLTTGLKRGTRSYLAPEQTRHSFTLVKGENVPNKQIDDAKRRYGAHTNIYGIAASIYCLMTLERSFPSDGRTYVSNINKNLARGETIGENLELGPFSPVVRQNRKRDNKGRIVPNVNESAQDRLEIPYSKELVGLVLECLMQDYTFRPTTEELLNRATDGYNMALQKWPEPELNTHGEARPENPEPAVNLEEPFSLISRTPTDEWNETRVKGIKFKPLQIVMERQANDMKRKRQRSAARQVIANREEKKKNAED